MTLTSTKIWRLELHVYQVHFQVSHPQARRLRLMFALDVDTLHRHHHRAFDTSTQHHLHITFDTSAQHHHHHLTFDLSAQYHHHRLVVEPCAQRRHHRVQKRTRICCHHLTNVPGFHQHPFAKDVHQAPNPRPRTMRMVLRRCCSAPCTNMPALY